MRKGNQQPCSKLSELWLSDIRIRYSYDNRKRCIHQERQCCNKKISSVVNRFIENIRSSRKLQIKIAAIFVAIALAIILPIALTVNARQYKKAEELYNNGAYAEAASEYSSILEYEDSQNKYNACIFNQAKALYDEEKFEEAKTLFLSLNNFNGADIYAQKCDYFLSVDGRFLLDFSKGINERWRQADIFDSTEYTTFAEYVDDFRNMLINTELSQVEKYKGMEFSDQHLQELCNKYIEALEESSKALDYIEKDFDTYDKRFNDATKTRTMVITELLDKYDLKVEKGNERTAESFHTNAEVYAEDDAIENALKNALDNVHFELIESSYDWKTYEGYFTNESKYALEYFTMEVRLLDKNGTIIEENYCSGADSLEPGQKARYEFMTDKSYDKIEVQINYTAKK